MVKANAIKVQLFGIMATLVYMFSVAIFDWELGMIVGSIHLLGAFLLSKLL